MNISKVKINSNDKFIDFKLVFAAGVVTYVGMVVVRCFWGMIYVNS